MVLTTKILLNKTRRKNDGTYALDIRLTYTRKVIYFPTGISLREKDWDVKNQIIKSSSNISNNITRLNNLIGKKKSRIYDVVAQLEDDRKINQMSMLDIKKLITSDKNDDKMDVLQFIQSIIDELIRARKKGNAIVYRNLKKKLEKFHGKKTLSFQEINYAFLRRLEAAHFANDYGRGGLSVYMRTLRAVYNRAIRSGYAVSSLYPFEDYKIKNGDPNRRSLTEKEFEILKSKKLKKRSALYEARKLFLASFYMRGMNWMDMCLLKMKNIEGDFDRIQYVRSKTKKRFSIKINDKLKEILFSYHKGNESEEEFLFPVLRSEEPVNKHYETIKNKRKRLNKRLKDIAELCEIDPFTIYAARHTYATMGKRKGVPTAVIQESLGHKTEAITQTYLDSFDNKIIDDYDKIIMND
jgi:integrase